MSLICLFAAIFVGSGVMLVNTLIGYRQASDLYDRLHNDFMDKINKTTGEDPDITAKIISTRPGDNIPATPDDTTSPSGEDGTTAPVPGVTEPPDTTPDPPDYSYSEKFLNVRKTIFEYKEINTDIIGYIYIEFSPSDYISYPVLLGEDNEYYVTHAYNKTELKSGSIFLDARCHANVGNNYISLLYGHNMNNGTMFHKLTYFKQKQYFNNVQITLYTLEGIYTYEVFSVYNTNSEGDFSKVNFSGDAEYLDYLNKIQAASMLDKNITLTPADKVLTLSTCINTSNSARLAVHAVLMSIAR